MNPIVFSLPAGLGWATSSMNSFVRLQAAQMRWDTIQSTKLAIAAGIDRLWSNGATCSDRRRRMSKNRSDPCQVWRWLSLETDTCWMNGSLHSHLTLVITSSWLWLQRCRSQIKCPEGTPQKFIPSAVRRTACVRHSFPVNCNGCQRFASRKDIYFKTATLYFHISFELLSHLLLG